MYNITPVVAPFSVASEKRKLCYSDMSGVRAQYTQYVQSLCVIKNLALKNARDYVTGA